MRKHPSGRAGLTLVELVVATVVSIGLGLSVMNGVMQGTHIFRANETEMWAREKGSRMIRKMYTDMAKATGIHIYPNYQSTGGAETLNGSCVVLDLPDSGTSVAYYLVGATSGTATGSIYYDSNAGTAPNPANDRLLHGNVGDLEFRRNPNGTTRVGMALGTLGYTRRKFGTVENDLVRYTVSVTRRN